MDLRSEYVKTVGLLDFDRNRIPLTFALYLYINFEDYLDLNCGIVS